MPFMGIGLDPQIEQKLRQHPELAKWSPEAAPYLKGQGPWTYPADFSGVVLSSGLATLLHKDRVYADVPKDQPVEFIDCKAADVAQKVAMDSNVQLSAAGWNGGPWRAGTLRSWRSSVPATARPTPTSSSRRSPTCSACTALRTSAITRCGSKTSSCCLGPRVIWSASLQRLASMSRSIRSPRRRVAPYYSGTLNIHPHHRHLYRQHDVDGGRLLGLQLRHDHGHGALA